MRIVIMVETFNREFYSKLNFSKKLIEDNNDIEVVFGSDRELIYSLPTLEADLIFVNNPDYSPLIFKSLKLCKSNGSKLILLDNEGGIFNNINSLIERANTPIINLIDFWFVWGSKQKEYIANSKIFSEDNIIVTGTPFFETLRPKSIYIWDKYFSKIDLILKKSNYILINTRFSIGNESVKNQYRHLNSQEVYDYEEKLIESFISLAKKISKNISNKKIVFRPHPSEGLEIYKDAFRDYENIIVTREFPVQSWLVKTDILIHNGCTTAIEAHLSKVKKIISYKKHSNDKLDFLISDNCSKIVKSESEIINLINEKNFENNYNLSDIGDVINNFNDDSNILISDFIRKITFKKNVLLKFSFQLFLKALKNIFKERYFYKLVLNFLPKNYTIEHEYQQSKLKIINKDSIQDFLHLDSRSKYKVSNYLFKKLIKTKNVFIIKKLN